jgi:hypothetical protein
MTSTAKASFEIRAAQMCEAATPCEAGDWPHMVKEFV